MGHSNADNGSRETQNPTSVCAVSILCLPSLLLDWPNLVQWRKRNSLERDRPYGARVSYNSRSSMGRRIEAPEFSYLFRKKKFPPTDPQQGSPDFSTLLRLNAHERPRSSLDLELGKENFAPTPNFAWPGTIFFVPLCIPCNS